MVRKKYAYLERRVCRALGVVRAAARCVSELRVDESAPRQSLIALAVQNGR